MDSGTTFFILYIAFFINLSSCRHLVVFFVFNMLVYMCLYDDDNR